MTLQKKKLQQKRFVFSRRSYAFRICIDPTVASGWGQSMLFILASFDTTATTVTNPCFFYVQEALRHGKMENCNLHHDPEVSLLSCMHISCIHISKTFLVSFLKCFSLLSSSTQEILHFDDEVIPFVNPVIVGFELRHSSK